MTPEARRDLGRRLGIARRHLAEADRLVEVGSANGRSRWRSVLADGSAVRMERAATAALAGDDRREAGEAIARFERAVARARRDAEERR
jgi:hypothetical protein